MAQVQCENPQGTIRCSDKELSCAVTILDGDFEFNGCTRIDADGCDPPSVINNKTVVRCYCRHSGHSASTQCSSNKALQEKWKEEAAKLIAAMNIKDSTTTTLPTEEPAASPLLVYVAIGEGVVIAVLIFIVIVISCMAFRKMRRHPPPVAVTDIEVKGSAPNDLAAPNNPLPPPESQSTKNKSASSSKDLATGILAGSAKKKTATDVIDDNITADADTTVIVPRPRKPLTAHEKHIARGHVLKSYEAPTFADAHSEWGGDDDTADTVGADTTVDRKKGTNDKNGKKRVATPNSYELPRPANVPSYCGDTTTGNQ